MRGPRQRPPFGAPSPRGRAPATANPPAPPPRRVGAGPPPGAATAVRRTEPARPVAVDRQPHGPPARPDGAGAAAGWTSMRGLMRRLWSALWLLVLLLGVPAALAGFLGWPLPDHWPTRV